MMNQGPLSLFSPASCKSFAQLLSFSSSQPASQPARHSRYIDIHTHIHPLALFVALSSSKTDSVVNIDIHYANARKEAPFAAG